MRAGRARNDVCFCIERRFVDIVIIFLKQRSIIAAFVICGIHIMRVSVTVPVRRTIWYRHVKGTVCMLSPSAVGHLAPTKA
jgi:hypothetical protein